MNNPLLQFDTLPRFSEIKPEHVAPAIDSILADNRETLSQVLARGVPHTWDTLVAPLEEMEDRLGKAWSPVGHLHAVADSEGLRKAYNECLPKLSDYSTDLLQNHELYLAYRAIAEGGEYRRLDQAQRKIIDNTLREFRLAGVTLEAGIKREFKEIEQALSSSQTKFEENVLDATHAWTRVVTDRAALEGLPESAVALAAHNAREKGVEGWLFTLDYPSYYPVMQYANDRALREEMYAAYVTRASDQGPGGHEWDNSAVMEKILALRSRKADLLGFDSYAHYSLARKMADTPDQVLKFLRDLADRSMTAARAEYAELQAYARDQGLDALEPWDIAYYSEKLRQHKYDISQEQLKPYFPAPRVVSGMFTLMQRLFGLDIRETENRDVWHPDVRFFEIHDQTGTHRGSFYLDLYARRSKRGGAWMDECRVRKRSGDRLQLPVAYLNCNFSPPVDGKPSLLTHNDVTTLFHEFGHGLHHMLTLIDYTEVSGINGVPWDAVELPSQFLENWCWDRVSLDMFSGHYETGATLPDDLFSKMISAKNFQGAMQMMRQLEFALFDFRLHYERGEYTSRGVQALLDEVRRETAVYAPPAYNRFQHGFTHIFAGGYAAGYYSYKWAEVLSSDAFSKFEEKGIFDRDTGERFLHTILEQGGSRDPMELFVEFRGREPSILPLLRHSGIPTGDTSIGT